MEMVTEIPAVTNLVVALEQAALIAKQLPSTTDPSQTLQIYSTLHAAHHHLSSFLSQAAQHSHPPLLIPPPLPPPPAAENSVTSAVRNGNDPMQVGDGDEELDTEQNWKATAAIERVEERMRDCFIQNKRSKRPLSPSAAAAAEQRQELVRGAADFDPYLTRLRALDLIYQFHG